MPRASKNLKKKLLRPNAPRPPTSSPCRAATLTGFSYSWPAHGYRGIWDAACDYNYDENEFFTALAKDRKKSREALVREFEKHFGTVTRFMDDARKMAYQNSHPPADIRILDPTYKPGRKLCIANLFPGLTFRLWGFDDVEAGGTFYFSFGDDRGCHLDKPEDVKIFGVANGRFVPMLSADGCLAAMLPGVTPNSHYKEPEVFLTIPGMQFQISRGRNQIGVQIPDHPRRGPSDAFAQFIPTDGQLPPNFIF